MWPGGGGGWRTVQPVAATPLFWLDKQPKHQGTWHTTVYDVQIARQNHFLFLTPHYSLSRSMVRLNLIAYSYKWPSISARKESKTRTQRTKFQLACHLKRTLTVQDTRQTYLCGAVYKVHIPRGNLHSSVSQYWPSYWPDKQGLDASQRHEVLSFSKNVQTGSGTHPAPHSVRTEVPSRR
jgi:hypothetical protein